MFDELLPEVFCTRWRRARIRHRCHECGGVIEPGEQYLYSSGIWEGEAASYKQCADCERLRADYVYGSEDSGAPAIGELADALADCADPYLLRRLIEIADRRASWALACQLRHTLRLNFES